MHSGYRKNQKDTRLDENQVLVYDSVLNQNQKIFQFYQFKNNLAAKDTNKILKGKKEALWKIVKLFLIHGISSLMVR